jgi:hypothetical protein
MRAGDDLVAGATWYGRGTSGHARGVPALILRVTALSVRVRFTGGPGGRRGQVFTIPIAHFRITFAPRGALGIEGRCAP